MLENMDIRNVHCEGLSLLLSTQPLENYTLGDSPSFVLRLSHDCVSLLVYVAACGAYCLIKADHPSLGLPVADSRCASAWCEIWFICVLQAMDAASTNPFPNSASNASYIDYFRPTLIGTVVTTASRQHVSQNK